MDLRAERDPRVAIRERPPLLDFREVPKNQDPRQPIASEERFLTICQAADGVLMKVWWGGRARLVRSPVQELIQLSAFLGTRIGQLVRLRSSYLHLDPARGAPYGYIVFPGSGKRNKNEKSWEAVLTAESRPVIDRLLVEYVLRGPRGADDLGYLFPHPYELTAPITVDIASELHDLAERAAHVAHLDGGCWHVYRRKFCTELSHHNPAVSAATTGRKDVTVMLERYVKVSRGAKYEAVSQRRPLWEDSE